MARILAAATHRDGEQPHDTSARPTGPNFRWVTTFFERFTALYAVDYTQKLGG
jgi:hypothetical protein